LLSSDANKNIPVVLLNFQGQFANKQHRTSGWHPDRRCVDLDRLHHPAALVRRWLTAGATKG
jgi:hypothetical protein